MSDVLRLSFGISENSLGVQCTHVLLGWWSSDIGLKYHLFTDETKLCVCVHACVHACMHVCMYVCIYIYIYIYIYMCVCVCVYIYIYIYIYIYMYIYIHTHTHIYISLDPDKGQLFLFIGKVLNMNEYIISAYVYYHLTKIHFIKAFLPQEPLVTVVLAFVISCRLLLPTY